MGRLKHHHQQQQHRELSLVPGHKARPHARESTVLAPPPSKHNLFPATKLQSLGASSLPGKDMLFLSSTAKLGPTDLCSTCGQLGPSKQLSSSLGWQGLARIGSHQQPRYVGQGASFQGPHTPTNRPSFVLVGRSDSLRLLGTARRALFPFQLQAWGGGTADPQAHLMPSAA